MSKKRQLTKPALKILKNRYLLKNEAGKVVETPDEMFRRVATAASKAEKTPDLRAQWAEKFYEDMSNLFYLPNSPTLMNARKDGNHSGSLSACFQLTPEDDEEDILDCAKRMGMILKHGGGVGICLSKLRERGAKIRSTHGIAHGPVMALKEVYRAVPHMITQGGKRQAAMLANLDVRHPDIEKFITVKKDHLPSDSEDPGMALYNISVSADDNFMRLETNEDKNLFEKITQQATNYGCPGFLFTDTINKNNPYLENMYDKENPLFMWGGNPCLIDSTWIATAKGPRQIKDLIGQEFTAVLEEGYFNSTEKGFFFTGEKEVFEVQTKEGFSITGTKNHRLQDANGAWLSIGTLKPGDKLALSNYKRNLNKETFTVTVENIVPKGIYPVYDATIPEIHKFNANGFIAHNCGEYISPPNSACNLASINLCRFVKDNDLDVVAFRQVIKRAVRFLDDIVSINFYPDEKITEYAKFSRDIGLGIMGFADALAELEIPYGSDASIVFMEKVAANLQGAAQEASEALGDEKGVAPAFDQRKVYKVKPRRNVSLLVIAPGGSLSIFADCVGGIEPIFALVELREQGGIKYFHCPPPVRRALPKEIIKKLDHILEASSDDAQKLKEASAFVELAIPTHIKTAHQVSWKEKIDVVATLQKYVDRSISHTLNLPYDTKVEDVREAVKYAWKSGVKGITVYRDGCIPMQPYTALSTLKSNSKQKKENSDHIIEVPDKCSGDIHRIKVDMGRDGIENVYVMVGLAPGTQKPFQIFVIGRVEDLDPAVKQIVTGLTRMTSIALRYGTPLSEVVKQLERTEGQYINSIPAKLAKILSSYLQQSAQINGYKCNECGAPARKEGGCMKCTKCDWSSCG